MSCGCDEIGRHVGFRFQCESVQVQVLSSAPNSTNPNPKPIGEGFGFVIFIDYPNFNSKRKN